MGEKLLFLTGRLAHDSLRQELDSLAKRDFEYEVRDLGLKVAALMTADMIARRLEDVSGFDRILVPGLCGGDVEALSDHFGVPVERGPKDLKDLPEFFGGARRAIDLSRHSVLIFAEIVDAPHVSVDAVVERAERYRRDGADVIDLGCLPGTPFEHLEECVAALHERDFRVSVDSLEVDELLRAGRAGADYLLSLRTSTLHVADEVDSTPVLIPDTQGDLDSLVEAVEHMERKGRAYFADAILDPIHFGFTDSIVRFHELRRRLPQAPVMMGVGNVTELTDADTTGINAVLFGIISELGVDAVLATEVSRHATSAVREADAARRMMFAAHADRRLPRGYSGALMTHHEKKPFTHDDADIAAIAAAVRDRNFRIQVSENGLHVYNRDGHHRGTDPFALYPHLDVDTDGSHAFYLGVELGRAQIAWQLGKRYLQDNELEWGALLAPQAPPDIDLDTGYKRPGETLKRRRAHERQQRRRSGESAEAPGAAAEGDADAGGTGANDGDTRGNDTVGAGGARTGTGTGQEER